MKKRSLASAIAMLVVSAIVLTSATFAWFLGSSQADVTAITATVDVPDGNLQISADPASVKQWTTSIDAAAIKALQATAFPAVGDGETVPVLTPVTVVPPTDKNDVQIRNGSFGDDGKTLGVTGGSATDGTGNLIKFDLWVRTGKKAGTVTVSVADVTKGSNFTNIMVYESTKDATRTNMYLNCNPYRSIITTGEFVDTNGDGIISVADNSAYDDTKLSKDAITGVTDALTLNFDDTHGLTDKKLTVLCWAEGQDSNCCVDLANNEDDTSFGLHFAFAAADAE